MDLIIQLPKIKRGNAANIVFVDRLSKTTHLAAVPAGISAEEFARVFMREVFRQHGMPSSLFSDRDPRFSREVCKALGVSQNLSTVFHPQSDGQPERMNRVLEDMLRAYVGYDEWDLLSPCCEFAMNNAVQSSVRTTPFYVRQIASRKVTKSSVDSVQGLHHSWEEAKRCLRKAQERQTRYATQHRREASYEDGHFWCCLKLKIEGSRKLTHRFVGPFGIVKGIGKVAYELKLTQGMPMHDVFHVSLLRPYRIKGEGPLPAVLPTGIIEYEVEKILKHADDADNHRRYFVKWTGFEVPTC